MMGSCKKKTAVFMAIGVLVLGVGIGVGTVSAMLVNKPANAGTPTSSQSFDGNITAAFKQNKNYFGGSEIRLAESVSSTIDVTFTLTPDDVSDKNIIVSVDAADAAKVGLSTTNAKSGVAVTLTCLSVFTGTVNVTAYPEILPTSKVVVPVTIYNTIKELVPYSIENTKGTCWKMGSDDAKATSDLSYGSYTSSSLVWHSSDNTADNELHFKFEAFGYDTTRDPADTSLGKGVTDDGKHYSIVEFALADSSVAKTYDATLGEASFSATEVAYVAPTGISASPTSLQF